MCDSTKVIGGQFLQQIILKSKTKYNISKLFVITNIMYLTTLTPTF